MGRRPFFQINDRVRIKTDDPPTGVVVDKRTGQQSRRYLVVHTDARGRSPGGKPVWYEASDLEPTGEQNVEPARRYRANLFNMGQEENCYCPCCRHETYHRVPQLTKPTLVSKQLQPLVKRGDTLEISLVEHREKSDRIEEKRQRIARADVTSSAGGRIELDVYLG